MVSVKRTEDNCIYVGVIANCRKITRFVGTLQSQKQKSVWRTLTSSLKKTTSMNVELYIVCQGWTVKKLLENCRFVRL